MYVPGVCQIFEELGSDAVLEKSSISRHCNGDQDPVNVGYVETGHIIDQDCPKASIHRRSYFGKSFIESRLQTAGWFESLCLSAEPGWKNE